MKKRLDTSKRRGHEMGRRRNPTKSKEHGRRELNPEKGNKRRMKTGKKEIRMDDPENELYSINIRVKKSRGTEANNVGKQARVSLRNPET